MDYEVGSIAALISGDVTPNRPKVVRRALTPIKHQQSPNVTPKSEFVDDRSIFLSPSLQKKKAIVKKSPKRIFQNPNLDVTSDNSTTSPKADKVKKHLEDDLDNDNSHLGSPKSPGSKHNMTPNNSIEDQETAKEENKIKKNKKIRQSLSDHAIGIVNGDQSLTEIKNLKQKGKLSKNQSDETHISMSTENMTPKNKTNKKRKSTEPIGKTNEDKIVSNNEHQQLNENMVDIVVVPQKKKKTSKKLNTKKVIEETNKSDHTSINSEMSDNVKGKSKKKNKTIVNPNAIIDKDSDSEHESDNEIESETEYANNEILDTGPVDDSSDEEEEPSGKAISPKVEVEPVTIDEIKRTLFVGNVPFSNKCKKEIKSIFNKYGAIETIRIRTVPVKDGRVTPKLAVIKNELHPDRSTVNVYVKFKESSSVDEALIENNTVLNNNHLRVSRSDSTGAEHDPRLSVFVGNLPFALEDEGLREKFEKCGNIVSVRIIRDKKTNAGKGFGYVNFESKDGVELALALTDEDLTIKNRILRVKRCTQVSNKSNNRGNNFKGKQFNQNGRYNQNKQGKNFSRNYDGKNIAENQGRKFPGQYQGRNFSGQTQGRNFTGQNQGRNFSGQNQGRNFSDQNHGRNFSGQNQRRNFSGQNQGRNFSGQNQGRNFSGHNQGRNISSNNDGNNQFKGKQNFGQNQRNNDMVEGAERRIMNKRKNQESGEVPTNERPNFKEQPREKKVRKEFVGMTSEKKKKHTFNKGDKKKKILSEILANK
ncbi:uncharacterized protein LOC131841255 [Achroia grisella]|uniref:uncharacterized protein LOC131841255 n=1 Tax=Achroia grisella TaxID=688607 RepID=UPI0027D31479|nr:uncharacterized protein LOC131841255 [Achroia grisella]